MLLHWSPRSPFVRKVMVVAHELGLADRLDCVRTVVAAGEPNEALLEQNPQSRLPTLVLDNGDVLYDSRVICEYLDTLHDGPRLFPAAAPARMIAMKRQALGDGMLDTGLDWLIERSRLEEHRSQKFIDAFRRKTTASLDALEREDLAGGLSDIGLIGIAVALGYLDFRFADENWRVGRPRLAAWHEGAAARESMRRTLPREG